MIAWRRLLGLWDTEQANTKVNHLADLTDQARLDWLYAQSYFKTVTDPDLIEYAAFLIKAYERRYMYLLKQARQASVCHPGVSMSAITEPGTMRRAF